MCLNSFASSVYRKMLLTSPQTSSFHARQHICYSAYMLSPVRLSVRRVDHRKAEASNKGGVGKISSFLPLSLNISKTVTDTAKVATND